MSPTLMQCPKCHQGNPEWARFCNGCGEPMPEGAATIAMARDLPPVPEAPRAGLLVAERYRLLREIGRGAFGVVFEAKDLSTGDAVAVKFLNVFLMVSGFEGQQMRDRFAREWSAGSKLFHPGIARMLDSGEDRGVPFIVMELVPGETLGQLLARHGRLPLERGLAIVMDVLDALGHAHDQGVIHRDIKPSNVMVDGSGHARLMDFGIAKLLETFSGSLMTQTGLLGTPSYMSPEQASGGKIDRRSDLFSVGLLAYEVLTGRRAFEGHPAAIISQILTKDVPATPELPRTLQEWIARATHRDRDERFASAAEMRDALARSAATLSSLTALETMASPRTVAPARRPPAPPATPLARPTGAPRRGRRSLSVALGVLAALVAIQAVHGIFRKSVQRSPYGPSETPPLPAAPGDVEVPEPPEPPSAIPAALAEAASDQAQFLARQSELRRLQTDHYLARRRQNPGLARGRDGFEMLELALESVGRTADGVREAYFRGPDSTWFSMQEGDRVEDGTLTVVEDNHVRFVPLTPDPTKMPDEAEVTLYLPGAGPDGWGENPLDRAPEPIDFPEEGTVHITSKPSGATILVDGKEIGETPADLDVRLNHGAAIVVKLDGYVEFEDPAYVQRQEEATLAVDLVRRGVSFGAVALETNDRDAMNRAVAKLARAPELHPFVLRDGTPMLIAGVYREPDVAAGVVEKLKELGFDKARVEKRETW
ncbi:MAG: protein kinase [Acidobacteriota bacterium]